MFEVVAVCVIGALAAVFTAAAGLRLLTQSGEFGELGVSLWARGTLAPSTGPSDGERIMRRARLMFASFPEVTQVVTQVGRPGDGTDSALFANTEYFVDLKPKDQWRPVFHQNKDELIRAMDREVEKIPGALWNFSQPIRRQHGGSCERCKG
jgi:heavy metal efflux system protein